MRDSHQHSSIRSYVYRFIVALFLLGSAFETKAQLPEVVSSETEVSLLTIFPGDPTYSAWGHSALRLRDPATGLDVAFNYGTFDITVPFFIPRFAYGDMMYQLSVDPTSALLRGSAFQERGVIEQTLRLDSTQTAKLYSILQHNLLPQNKTYLYDFVFDNCSTRLVDLLLEVNALELPEQGPWDSTIRDMLDEFVHERAWLDWGIDMVLGSTLDKEPSLRQRTFLPTYLMDILDLSTTPSGEPVVTQTRTLLEPVTLQTERTIPVTFWFSLVLTFIGVYVSFRFPNVNLDRWLFGLIGFVGLFLGLMWFGTKHHVTGWNWNLAWALPTHLYVAVFWTKMVQKTAYFTVTFWWTLLVVVLSFLLPQAIPLPSMPLIVLLLWRLWIHSGKLDRSGIKITR